MLPTPRPSKDLPVLENRIEEILNALQEHEIQVSRTAKVPFASIINQIPDENIQALYAPLRELIAYTLHGHKYDISSMLISPQGAIANAITAHTDIAAGLTAAQSISAEVNTIIHGKAPPAQGLEKF